MITQEQLDSYVERAVQLERDLAAKNTLLQWHVNHDFDGRLCADIDPAELAVFNVTVLVRVSNRLLRCSQPVERELLDSVSSGFDPIDVVTQLMAEALAIAILYGPPNKQPERNANND